MGWGLSHWNGVFVDDLIGWVVGCEVDWLMVAFWLISVVGKCLFL